MSNTPEGKEPIELFIHGYGTAYDVLLTRLEQMQSSLNDVMGIHMDSDNPKAAERIAELSSYFDFINHIKNTFEDTYFTKLDEIKASPEKAWENLD